MKKSQLKQFISTFTFLQQFCPAAIDQMFVKMIGEDWSQESLDTNKHLIVCFLRTNYSIKETLPHYQDFLNKSITYLKNNKEDPKGLLHGII